MSPINPTDRVQVERFAIYRDIYSDDDEIHYEQDNNLAFNFRRGTHPNVTPVTPHEGTTLLVELDFESDKCHRVLLDSDTQVQDLEAIITILCTVRDQISKMEG